ncbi:MAG TPA: glycogen synthase GlgA [Vicinamibacterales bacterium]|nr:glycogen synthase GlgA [Vicinamibacterales bacterium]
MVTPEAAPFAKTGGLADVAGSLPLALGRLGHDVTVVLPRYQGIDAGEETGALALTVGGRVFETRFHRLLSGDRVRYIFVDVPELYDREGLYGDASDDYADNAVRFAVLARAALEYAARLAGGAEFSVVHAHEWQCGLVPLYLERRLPSLFTIHNLAFQGLVSADWLSRIDVPPHLFTQEGLEYWGKASLLKAGINFSDGITTVSPRYAKEILTEEYGFGFEGILAARKEVLWGILNGIDVERWDPQHDPHLPEPFSTEDLSGKLKAKAELLRAFRLPSEADALDRPVIGMVSRLTDQKGFDLIHQASTALLGLNATYVLIGSGERRYEDTWERLAMERPERVGTHIGFDERLAHLVEGGADIFLMPSRFEPCGLNQMYSLRYGTVPVVRATGGLDDTVVNYNERSGRGTGFKFTEYTPQALVRTVKRALKLFGDRKKWRALQLAGMRQDFSWDVSAREYVKVYRSVRRRFDGIRENQGLYR